MYVGVVVQLSLQASRVANGSKIVWGRFRWYKEWMVVVTWRDQTTNRLLVLRVVVHGLVFGCASLSYRDMGVEEV